MTAWGVESRHSLEQPQCTWCAMTFRRGPFQTLRHTSSVITELPAFSSTMEMGMKVLSLLVRAAMRVALTLIAFTAVAADYPTPQEGDWVARGFPFHTRGVMQELHLDY